MATDINESQFLEIRDLSFSYSSKTENKIISHLNFSIKKNEVVAIVGPNGAGKTTLLKLIVGLIKPSEGIFIFKNKTILHQKDLLRSIGLVFQNPDEQVFFPRIEEDIAFGLRNLGIHGKDIEERVHMIMHKLKITYLTGRSFFSLSFGEKKKVSIAGVLVTRPEIMILDEPTIGLDPWSKNDITSILKDLASESSLVIVTHDYDLLKQVNRIFFLWKGTFIRIFENYSDFEKFSSTFDPTRE